MRLMVEIVPSSQGTQALVGAAVANIRLRRQLYAYIFFEISTEVVTQPTGTTGLGAIGFIFAKVTLIAIISLGTPVWYSIRGGFVA
jgi:tetrahydromethanopterin S-methyltransferase subunit F